MVAIEMTADGPEVDPLGSVAVHPAAELFPLLQGSEFDELVDDIREHGQRDPIVMTPDGQLLDGRNRWRACAKVGVTPVTRVEMSEPWAFVISTNVHRRHLSESQRAMIAARIAERSRGGSSKINLNSSIDDLRPQPPTQAEAARLLNIGGSSITRAREVMKNGTPQLQRAVEAGGMPVYTAARVARELTPDQQDDFVERVENGASPSKLAANLEVASDRQPRAQARADNRSPKRHRHVGVPALRSLRDSLDALDLLLRSTPDGLDPSITSEEAAQWLDDLSRGRGAIRRVQNLLIERKESIP